MRIAITGVAGFIGFHLASRLLDEGHTVIGLDNLNDYYDVLLKQARLAELEKKGLIFERVDVADPQIHNFLSFQQPEKLVHLAAQAGVRYAFLHPEAYTHSNLLGFSEVLDWVKKNQQVPLIYASSSSVYGNSSKVPFSEKDSACLPESYYAATKRANELMAYSYHQTFGIKTCGLRFFTVYGPWGRPDMAYYSFTKAFIENKPLKIFHQGKALRDYTYIDDIVSGIYSAIFSNFECEIYNLGNHHPESILDLVAILESHFNAKANLVFEEGPKGDVDQTFADISHAKANLGFTPNVSLKEGMGRFLAWFENYHKISCHR